MQTIRWGGQGRSETQPYKSIFQAEPTTNIGQEEAQLVQQPGPAGADHGMGPGPNAGPVPGPAGDLDTPPADPAGAGPAAPQPAENAPLVASAEASMNAIEQVPQMAETFPHGEAADPGTIDLPPP